MPFNYSLRFEQLKEASQKVIAVSCLLEKKPVPIRNNTTAAGHSWLTPDVISEKGKNTERVSGGSCHSPNMLWLSPALKQTVKSAESLFAFYILC